MENNYDFFAATREYNTYEKHIAAPYIRKTFETPEYKKAVITVTGLGFYDIFINGKKITKGLLAPYISNPDDIVYFDEYDVTELLNVGKNAVGLILGNGMQNAPGGKVWDFDLARFHGVPRFAMSVTYTLEDGMTKTEYADSSFRCAPSPILFDDLRSGVIYDASKELIDWCDPKFDDSSWDNVYPAEAPRGEYRICSADPIKVRSELKAIEIRDIFIDPVFNNRQSLHLDTEYKFDFKHEKGTLYDFGVNTAGILRLEINGEKGQMIFIQMCEHIKKDGHATYKNINFYPDGYAQTVRYFCKGGKEVFETPFTYFGARYAVVYGLTPEQKTTETITLLEASSDLSERGYFKCSDEIMNKLVEMARRSDLANFYYFPTDCPHREKNGWTGDAAVSAEHVLMTLTPEKSYREWLRNICAAQKADGSLPGIIPTGGWGFEWGNGPAWDNVLTELCMQIYRLRGDLTPAWECKDAMLLYLNYISQKRRPDGLIAIGLGDWLQPSKAPGSPTAPQYLTDSVICKYIAEKSAVLFKAMGLELQTEFAEKLRDSFKAAIRRNLIDFGTMTVLSRCETAQAICIYYGIFEDSEKAAASDVLVKLIHEKGDHVDCGMIGLRTIYQVLSKCGQGELAWKMITRTDFPSYGSFVKNGLTSLPEAFVPDNEWDTGTPSLNHHFFGDIVSWAIKNIAGISPNPRGLSPDDVDITPDFIGSLSFAEAEYIAPSGRIFCRWERVGGEIKLTLECPENVTGYIILPEGFVFSDPENAYGSLNISSMTEIRAGIYSVLNRQLPAVDF